MSAMCQVLGFEMESETKKTPPLKALDFLRSVQPMTWPRQIHLLIKRSRFYPKIDAWPVLPLKQ